MKALGEFLRPEFLNRVDEVICFNRLSEENFRQIATIMLKELEDNLKERGITLQFDTSILDYLTKKSYSIQFGARNLRRTIQKEIEAPISMELIDSYMHPISSITLSAENDQIHISAQ